MITEVVLLGQTLLGVDLIADPVFETTPVLTGRRGPQGEKGDPGEGGSAAPVQSVNNRVGHVDGLAEAEDLGVVADGLTAVQTVIPTLATKTELDDAIASIPDTDGLATDAELAAVAASIPTPGSYATPADLTSTSTADRDRANHTGFQPSTTISDFLTSVDSRITAQKAQPNGLATLDASGLLPVSQLPPMAIGTTQVVNSQAAMLALTAETGDVAIRSDIHANFRLAAMPASTLGNWLQLESPADAVTSVNGRIGMVTGLAEQADLQTTTDGLAAHVADLNNPHQTTTSQITSDTPYQRFTTDGDIARLANTSGVNTGDQNLSAYAFGSTVNVLDNTVPRFDGVTGKLLQGSLLIVDDNGYLRTGTLNTPSGAGTAFLAAPGGRAVKGLVVQQTLATGTANMAEFQRSDGGITMWVDSAASLRFQGAVDAGIYVTLTGAAIAGTNAKVQFQASNAASNALGVYGAAGQTADLQRWATSAGVIMTAIGADGKLLFGINGFQDVNLYRGGANILSTDDAFSAAGPVTGSNLSGTNTGDETLARVKALQATDPNAIYFLRHGATAGTARPTWAGPVFWDGSVSPTNIDLTKGDKYLSSI